MSYETHEPVQVLEVTVTGETLILRINGASPRVSRPFCVPDSAGLREIRQKYFDLDAEERESPGPGCERMENELGDRLAKVLFQEIDPVPGGKRLGDALDECLSQVQGGDYVRLLLSFDEPCLGNLPWELTRWTWRGEEICLGRDRRIALSRLGPGRKGFHRRHSLGRDRVLSILHIGIVPPALAEGGGEPGGRTEYELTRDFLRLIDDHVTRLHGTSRSSEELAQYWADSSEITGQPAEMDIVHWDSHGSATTVQFQPHAGVIINLSARELLERTQNAFLYVIRACDAAGAMPTVEDCGELGSPSFSTGLVAEGAPAVLGTHGAVSPKELAYLPILYPLMFQGLPLDYCVQYMRRFFANMNAGKKGPYDRWYKLVLRTASAFYLDAAPSRAPLVPGTDPMNTVAALSRKFHQLERAAWRSAESDEDHREMAPGDSAGDADTAQREVSQQIYATERGG